MPVIGGDGVVVRDIAQNGPAARAGLRVGDVIRNINGKVVSPDATPGPGTVSLVDEMDKVKPGDNVTLEVWHLANGKTSTVVVRAAEMPIEQAEPQPESQPGPGFPFP